jgi:hypothetical protein
MQQYAVILSFVTKATEREKVSRYASVVGRLAAGSIEPSDERP